MKVTRKDSMMAEFGMLSIGEVFKDTSGNILMKIQYIGTDTNEDINAIDLETGETAYLFGDEKVILLKAELIVE